MKVYILYAMLAGIAWGLGGYFEKAGLQAMKMPAIVGITLRTFVALAILGLVSLPAWKNISNPTDMKAWLMILIGGGIIAGSLGMWSFYAALSTSENLGVTLAVAFALSPITGTALGLIKGTQKLNVKIALGLLAIIGGIVLIHLANKTGE
jgi:bacterial/archaeal transporter family protein